jgi:hypothetical protein
MMRSTARSVLIMSLFLFLLFGRTEAGLEKASVDCKGNLMTVRGSQADVLSLLEEISELVGAEIFVFDGVTRRNGGVRIIDRPVEEVLQVLLKGHSYAIIYSSDPSPVTGVHILGKVTGRAEKMQPAEGLATEIALEADTGGSNGEISWEIEGAKSHLRDEIGRLEALIAAKESNKDHDPRAEELSISPLDIQRNRDLLESHRIKLQRLHQLQ